MTQPMTSTTDSPDDAPALACRPNFSGPGRRRRRTIAMALGVVGGALLAYLVGTGASAPARLSLALPLGAAALTGLQVTRNTCVAHAATGSFEHDDFTTTKVDDATAAASRRVARTIFRDALLVGLLAGALGYASAWIA